MSSSRAPICLFEGKGLSQVGEDGSTRCLLPPRGMVSVDRGEKEQRSDLSAEDFLGESLASSGVTEAGGGELLLQGRP